MFAGTVHRVYTFYSTVFGLDAWAVDEGQRVTLAI